ncbi:MAG: proline--tRNA ligase [Verrucomicrobiales bacterium]|jgi:prolyl-tRNA synthetase|nr:proline--tRNA ligase [Verrucomicrobiales bacterium]
MNNTKTAITPTRDQDFPEWYQQVIAAADLAENSDVRGCMIIKPWGYGLWEQIQRHLDRLFKDSGHENAYFPLFIPLSYLQKEAGHVAGFAKECAVVTHHRLEANADGELVPAGALTEPLIVRPTSETIIGASFARWVQSYRDLPLLLNQWANVVRWEMRPRLFLRTAEFLWQEGHTAHETKAEAVAETERMLAVYETFAKDYLALPVIVGEKSESERFPGAARTLCIEAMVQDRKAVQAGTSHFLGQNFAKTSGIQFVGRDNTRQFAFTTSWGVSTRLIGTLIMAHGDDNGVILPPRVAPAQVAILPVIPKPEQRAEILAACESLSADLRRQTWRGEPLRVKIDARDKAGGGKTWDWIKKGVPLRVEIGPRDLASGSVFVARRDQDAKARQSYQREAFTVSAAALLEEIQQSLYTRALTFRDANIRKIDTKEEFYAYFTPQNASKPEIHGGFALAHWCGDAAVEEQIKNDLKVTIRCIPFADAEPGVCPFTGKPSKQRVIFAKSY